jgi:hypothetical protein
MLIANNKNLTCKTFKDRLQQHKRLKLTQFQEEKEDCIKDPNTIKIFRNMELGEYLVIKK